MQTDRGDGSSARAESIKSREELHLHFVRELAGRRKGLLLINYSPYAGSSPADPKPQMVDDIEIILAVRKGAKT